jgi:hypothetical protein
MLPQKYFYDSKVILQMMQNNTYLADNSYNFTAYFYNTFNIFHTFNWVDWSIIINFIGIPIIVIFISCNKIYSDKKFIIWTICTLFLIELYIFNVGKDFITFIISSIIFFFLTRNRYKKLHFVFGLGILSYFMFNVFRAYFILIFIYFIFVSLFLNAKRYQKLLLLFSALLIFFALPDDLFNSIFNIREITNANRFIVDSQTMFINIFSSNGNRFLDLVNYLINIARFIFPVETILIDFNIQYALFSIYIISITIMTIYNLVFFSKITSRFKYIPVFILSIIFVSAIFEPDFGSYLRHVISYFFLLYGNIILFMENLKKRKTVDKKFKVIRASLLYTKYDYGHK